MNIKAIETTYKGYKFRSRLEARWAVFFEEHGEDWQYEVEGFELPSGRYLPDFFLPKRDMFVEVKPSGDIESCPPPHIYMAGRMGAHDYRPFDPRYNSLVDSRKSALPMFSCRIGGIDAIYTGPFTCSAGNHCGVHGVMDDGAGYEGDIFNAALTGIRNCDVFFAVFEDLEAFGTLVEVGYARALKKTVIIGFNNEKFSEFSRKEEYCEWMPTDRYNPIWFAGQCADKCFLGSREEILKQFYSWLVEQNPIPREQQLAKELSEHTGKRVSLVHGDPVSAFENESAGILDFKNGRFLIDERPNFECWSYRERDRAALLARQARFEFGQSGAPA